MSFSAVLDVILGLAVIYYALSLAVSWITSVIAKYTQMSAKNLYDEIKAVLGDPTVKDLYDHPLIKSLTNHVVRLFSRDEESYLYNIGFLKAVLGTVDYIPANRFATGLLDILFGERGLISIEHIKTVIKDILPNGPQKDDLLRRIEDIKRVQDFEPLLEDWANSILEKTSEVYKRRASIIVWIASLLLTLIIGIDSIAIARHLWFSPIARVELAEVARSIQQDATGTDQADDVAKAIIEQARTGARVPFTWTCGELNAMGWYSGDVPYTVGNVLGCPGDARLELGPQPSATPTPDQESGDAPTSTPEQRQSPLNYLLLKFAGLLITWVAVAQGAPFWYRVLQSLRRAGSAPSDQEEKESPTPSDTSSTAPETRLEVDGLPPVSAGSLKEQADDVLNALLAAGMSLDDPELAEEVQHALGNRLERQGLTVSAEGIHAAAQAAVEERRQNS